MWLPRSRIGRVVAGAVGVTGVTVGVYVAAEPGVRRELRFWSVIGPCIARYVWVHKMVDDPEERSRRNQALNEAHAKPVVDLFMELGGPYIKLGQYLSVRPEIVGPHYRKELKKLQSEVPGKPFSEVEQVLLSELGDTFGEFASFDETPFGAASIGQVHTGVLRNGQQVAVKVQYPDVKWKFEVDFQCISNAISIAQTLNMIDQREDTAVKYFNEIRETSMRELDYLQERRNLEALRNTAGVRYAGKICIPDTIPHLCTDKIITMEFLEGPKLEEEVLRRLLAVGVDRGTTSVRSFFSEKAEKLQEVESRAASLAKDSYWAGAFSRAAAMIGPQTLLWIARRVQHARDLAVWTACSAVDAADWLGVASTSQKEWVHDAQLDLSTRRTEAETREWLDVLLDVHGHEIFQCPLYNSDPHPGNIIVMPDGRLGLIDYGQCMSFTDETTKRYFAELIVAVADNASDAEIAKAFRGAGIRTKNSNDHFTAAMARIMFGHMTAEMLNREWHVKLHAEDRVQAFPVEVMMVYRVAALLRGLSLALHHDLAVGDAWRTHAEELLSSTTAAI